MTRAGNTSPATLHMRAKEHGGLRAKQCIQNVGREDRLNIPILRQDVASASRVTQPRRTAASTGRQN
jgi:hypothetical protein